MGLGGRLDATNIVDNDLAVITSIDIDHTDFLGSTREEIGFEKAGIFRANKPVVIGEPNVPKPMLEQAEKLHCHVSRRDVTWSFKANEQTWMWQSNKVRLENLPFCQIPLANAATALAAVEQLPFDISVDTIKRSLIEVELVGRFQQLKGNQLEKLAERLNVSYSQLPKVIIDVGHNPHAAKYLAEKLTVLKTQISGRIIAVCGMLKDKDAESVFTQLTSVIDLWHCVTLGGYRGQSGDDLNAKLTTVCPSAKSISKDSVIEGVQSAVKNADKNDIVQVFGSFHTVGEFLEYLA